MGASDYMVGNAPGGMSYGAGNFAAQLYAMTRGLGEDYFKGTQNKRTLDLQNMFKDGLPTGEDGQPLQGNDLFNAVQSKMLKTGGAEYAKPLLDMLLAQQGQKTAQG